jgi:hypothetical protein
MGWGQLNLLLMPVILMPCIGVVMSEVPKNYKKHNQANFGMKFLEGGVYVMPHIIIIIKYNNNNNIRNIIILLNGHNKYLLE